MRIHLPTILVLLNWLQSARAEEPPTFFGKTVDGWIEVLRDKASTANDRSRAVVALGYFGPLARAAAPDLIEEVRRGRLEDESIEALVHLGVGSEMTVPRLIERFLKEGCERLTGMGTIGSNPRVRDLLVEVGGPAVPALLKVLDGPDLEMRVCAAEVLGDIGPAATAAIPALIRTIERPGPGYLYEILGRHAVGALGGIGPAARDAIPVLTGLLDKEAEAVVALDRIGATPIKFLIDEFLGEDAEPYPFFLLGPRRREAIPALRAALADKRPQVRISAAVALADIDPSVTEAIPVLIESFDFSNDESIDLTWVPNALAQFGTRAKAALPKLIDRVEKGSFNLDELKALVHIDPGGEVCVPALISALTSKDEEDGEDSQGENEAARSLGLLGPKAKDAIPALTRAMTRRRGEDFIKAQVGFQGDEALGRRIR